MQRSAKVDQQERQARREIEGPVRFTMIRPLKDWIADSSRSWIRYSRTQTCSDGSDAQSLAMPLRRTLKTPPLSMERNDASLAHA